LESAKGGGEKEKQEVWEKGQNNRLLKCQRLEHSALSRSLVITMCSTHELIDLVTRAKNEKEEAKKEGKGEGTEDHWSIEPRDKKRKRRLTISKYGKTFIACSEAKKKDGVHET